MKLNIRGFCAALGIAVFTLTASADNSFVVTTNSDSGAGSLRQAMLDANAASGGTITFSNVTGQIILASALPQVAANLNIYGPGTAALTISGNNSNLIFSVASGTTNTFRDFTIANAYALGESGVSNGSFFHLNYPGSAISNAGCLTVINCSLTNCINIASTFVYGGAVYNVGTLNMQQCQFAACGAPAIGAGEGIYGGCVYNGPNCYLTLTGCVMTNCHAYEGTGLLNQGTAVLKNCLLAKLIANSEANGGAIANSGPLTLLSCVISNCAGAYWGSGIYGDGGGIVMSNTVITQNGGAEQGGGLYLAGTNFFYGCTISGNDSGEDGGGIWNGGSTVMVNCTVSSNVAVNLGGAGVYNQATLAMTNCTVSGNYFSTYPNSVGGGGILNTIDNPDYPGGTNAMLYLTDCTIVSNTPGTATGGGISNGVGGTIYVQNSIIANNTSNDFSGTLTSLGYNLIGSTNGCALAGNLTGNLYGVDPLLGPLQYNGGTTLTHALLTGSPAIDAGPANSPPFFDERGVTRPQGSADDIGAFEFSSVPPAGQVAVSAVGNGTFCVQMLAPTGYSYTVQRAATFLGPWTSIATASPDATGHASCIDASPNAGSGFYRIFCQPH